MKLSFDWLCDFADFRKIEFNRILEKINLSISEIDDVEELDEFLESVITVKILKHDKHPDSDKLKISIVTDGKKEYQIVTGAPNLSVGDIVPLAKPGAKLDGKEIKESELRGVKSFGMFCSEKELGLSQDHSGVLIFPTNTELGISLRKLLHREDIILTIDNKSITHRPDLWSHFGFARELAAQLDLPLQFDPFSSEFPFTDSEKIKVNNSSECHSYFASFIENISVSPSHSKIKSRLEKCGIRSINNIVDVSNYVLLEMGQPTHFFDADTISDTNISIQKGKKGDKISLLDDTEKEIDEDLLMIYNNKTPIAIAGVMGGKETAVYDSTSRLVLESAVFPRELVRKSIRKTSIRSESSIRYEKGLNHLTVLPVIKRSLILLKENGCENLKAYKPVGFTNDPNKIVEIKTSFHFLNKKLGKTFEKETITKILNKLGFKTQENGDELKVVVPPYRHNYDVTIEEDIVEEVGRSIGYAEIGVQPLNMEVVPAVLNDKKQVERLIKKTLSQSFGYNEIYQYSFASKSDTEFEGLGDKALSIKNPMPDDLKFLRTSVYPSLLKKLVQNADRFETVKIYELARTYFRKENSLGDEIKYISLGYLKNRKTENPEELEEDFLKIRDEILSLLISLNIEDIKIERLERNYLHPGASLGFYSNDILLGELGYLHPEKQEEFEVKKRAIIGKLFLEDIVNLFTKNKRRFSFRAPSQYPQDSLDISLVMNENDSTENYARLVAKAGIEEIQDIWVSSIFKGESIGQGKKSITYRTALLNFKETFTQARINAISEQLTSIAKENGFSLR